MGGGELGQAFSGDAGSYGLNDELLDVLLRLGETDIGHQLDSENGVGDCPPLGVVADHQELDWAPVCAEPVVHALGEGIPD